MFKKLGQFMGMVGIKVNFDISEHIPSSATSFSGILHISAEQDQTITSVNVTLSERRETGSHTNDNHDIDNKVVGHVILDEDFTIQAGETKEIPFSFDFSYQPLVDDSGDPEMAKLFDEVINDGKVEYWLNALVDVKGAAFDPTASHQVWFR
jgi:sporulation-control protein spo0M